VGALLKLEERLERLVGGTFAKVFPSEIQPVEIVAALQRECDNRAECRSGGAAVAPNAYRVTLSPQDHDRLAPFGGELAAHLAHSVREYLRDQRYLQLAPVSVQLERAERLRTGVMEVRSRIEQPQPADGPRLEFDGRSVPLTGAEMLLGRGEEADIRFDDPGVSRRHARISLGPPPVIRDLGSTNGLLVDGRRAAGAELRDGSRIVIGETTVTYRTAA
jgi:hypothetical protein